MSGVIRVLLERPWIALVLALVIETAVLVVGQNDMVVADPLWYSKVAHDIAIDPGGVFAAPETHPFLMRVGLTLPLALFYKLFGVSLFVSNLPVLLAGLGVLLVVYAAAPTPRVKLIGLALCIACTPLLHLATVLGCDLPCATLMAVSVLWLARRDRPRGAAWLVAAVGAWFAAFLVKESAIWLAPVWIYAIVRDGLDLGARATVRKYVAALGVGAVLGAAYLMICASVWGDPLARFHGIDDLTAEHTWSMIGKPASAWLARLTYEPLQMFIEMFSIALIPVALSPWLVRDRDRLWVVAAASTIGLFWFGSSSLTAYAPLPISQRMALQALPPILVVAAIATDKALERWPTMRAKLGVTIAIVALLVVPYVRAVMTQLRRGHPEAAAYAELRHEVLDLHRRVVLVCGDPRCTSAANFYFDFAIPPNLTVVLATDYPQSARPADAVVRAIVNLPRSAPDPRMSREIVAAHLPTLYDSRDIKLYDAGDGVAFVHLLAHPP